MQETMQRAVLIGANLGEVKKFNDSMLELQNLAAACNIQTVGKVTQNLDRINPTFYIGKGKLEELEQAIEEKQADMIIFNGELSPSQLRNIEKVLATHIIDRTMLILDIFEQRAQTVEARIQVKIAKLQYFLPRLVGLRASLGRQSGGSGAGQQNKGAGEQKIELDRRKIQQEIAQLKKELAAIVEQRQMQRKWRKRQGIPTVAIVGYTNAGKSSLMNIFIERFHEAEKKEVLEKDMLFATLETASRRIDMAHHQSFLLTDTVGFVDNLPHHLVEAFKSTLEEIKDADLLLHVVDAANPAREEMIQVTNDTLSDLGVLNIPTIYLYNKADCITKTQASHIQTDATHLLFSTRTQQGFEELIHFIQQQLFANFQKFSLLIPYDKGEIAAFYHEHTDVLQETFEQEGTRLYIYAEEKLATKFHKEIIEVKALNM